MSYKIKTLDWKRSGLQVRRSGGDRCSTVGGQRTDTGRFGLDRFQKVKMVTRMESLTSTFISIARLSVNKQGSPSAMMFR